MAAMSNAQRQARWRERHIKGDLFPPISAYPSNQRYVTVKVRNISDQILATVELLPCPFCGSSLLEFFDQSFSGFARLICDDCQVALIGNYDKIVAAWNRRVR